MCVIIERGRKTPHFCGASEIITSINITSKSNREQGTRLTGVIRWVTAVLSRVLETFNHFLRQDTSNDIFVACSAVASNTNIFILMPSSLRALAATALRLSLFSSPGVVEIRRRPAPPTAGQLPPGNHQAVCRSPYGAYWALRGLEDSVWGRSKEHRGPTPPAGSPAIPYGPANRLQKKDQSCANCTTLIPRTDI